MRMMLFTALLLSSCAYALLRGGAPERVVAGSLLTAYVATLLAYSELPTRFEKVEIAVLLVDTILLLGLIAVALRADRVWPLFVAGLHLTTIGAHLIKFFDGNMIRVTYAVMIAAWSYPMLVLLAVGTWRHRRRLKIHGDDHPWTLPPLPARDDRPAATSDALCTAEAATGQQV